MPIAYLLLTHGPKPKGPIRDHPAVRQQLANLESFIAEKGKPEAFVFVADYARQHRSLKDLPKLEHVLKVAQDNDTTVIIDDFRRLFAHYAGTEVGQFLEELRVFKDQFIDLKTGMRLGRFSQNQLLLLCVTESPIKYVRAPTPRKPRSLEDRQSQTQKAKAISKSVRSKAANEKALELTDLRDKLQDETREVTLTQLADAASEAGLRTTRNNLWTASSVGRSLKRFEAKSDVAKTTDTQAKAALKATD
ncbi:hypothetical protein [Pelagimonas varians]|uniref:Uncharacterized protein n=1 Tax=Pelagimonas varians TaxID=696760 RepID=A0A238L5E6_9RHOB|nr:hypothetical protein [Pelagimonas varians]PYG26274.1 hypothetical protein C8N36_12617 [Pelagimonas varians]SMX50070.1 hypothetical protein PEV8663_04470 [Pelagimonas varians]